MTTAMNALVAREHVADMRRVAERRQAIPSGLGNGHVATIELRLATADEAHVVRRLASLDDAQDLEGQVLLARVGGEAVAALSLCDQRVVANPFVPTREAVALLRLRVAQLSGPHAHGWSRRLRRLRLA
jgi:hypothetical protein